MPTEAGRARSPTPRLEVSTDRSSSPPCGALSCSCPPGHLLEFFARFAQTCAHGAWRDREQAGNLRGRQLFELEEDEDRGEIEIERIEHMAQELACFALLEHSIGQGSLVGKLVT